MEEQEALLDALMEAWRDQRGVVEIRQNIQDVLQPLFDRVTAQQAILKTLVEECEPEFEPNAYGPDHWRCPLCWERVVAVYNPPGHCQPAPEPFPHAATCPIQRALDLQHIASQ